MRLKDGVMLKYLDFDTDRCLLSRRNTEILFDYFQNLDVHKKNTLNDVQFYHFMRHVTDLSRKQIELTFAMLDWQACGGLDFEAFYMLACILLCSEYRVEKTFMYRYSAPMFELLDVQGKGSIRQTEIQEAAFLFNLSRHTLHTIFLTFNIPKVLGYKDFKMFVMACAEIQEATETTQVQNRKDTCSTSGSQWDTSLKNDRPTTRRRAHFSYT